MILKTSYKMKPPISAKPIKSILKELGCVGLWLMNERGGLSAFDLSGNNNRGTLQGNTHFVPGKFGSALDFDGTVDYVEVANSDSLDMTSQITILVWVKHDSVAANYHCYLSKEQNSDDGYALLLNMNLNELALALPSSTWEDYSAPFNPNTDQWYQLVGTYDGSNGHIFIDGIEISGSASGTLGLNSNNENIRIGAASATIGNREITGQIDHLMLLDRALSAAEIAHLYRDSFYMFERRSRLLYTPPAAPPEVECLFMDLTTQYWAIKHGIGLNTKL